MPEWMVEEGALDPELALAGEASATYRETSSPLDGFMAQQEIAVFLKPLVINDTRKWFGEADIRLDALVVQGGNESGSLYAPHTFRFPRVADGDDVAHTDNGLMIYYGRPKHFLALTLTLSRDTKDSDDLAELISQQAEREDVASVLSRMTTAVASVQLATVEVAMKAALALGDVAYGLVRQISPKCLGLYRGNWLARKDNFGIGRHPPEGVVSIKDFMFAYEVVPDRAEPGLVTED